MKIIRLAALLSLLLTRSLSYADQWRLPPEVKDTNFVFGTVRIVLHYDSTHNTLYPDYSVKILDHDKQVAELKGLGFIEIFASPDNRYFLGVSNSGLTKTAYVVFDAHGKILKHRPHGSPGIRYHAMSVSLVRQWYDAKNPTVKFAVTDGTLKDVTINDPDQKPLSLLRAPEPKANQPPMPAPRSPAPKRLSSPSTGVAH